MSYNYSGGYATTFKPYDLYALNWIYGGDGIGGTYGYGSTNGPVIPNELYPAVNHRISAGTSVSEASGSFSFSVSRDGNLAVATTVAWSLSGSVDAADFGGTLPSGVLSFAAGETTKTVSFQASADMDAEADEAFAVQLGATTGNGARLVEPQRADFVLQDDDTGPYLSVQPVLRQLEGASGTSLFSFEVSRTGNLGRADSVGWTFVAGSADAADFAGGKLPTGGTLQFSAGQAVASLTIEVAGDTLSERDENFFIQLNATTWGTLSPHTGEGVILADDRHSEVSIALIGAAQRDEGAAGTEQLLQFRVTRSGETRDPLTVGWTRGGSVGSDDLAPDSASGGTLSFAAGQTEQIFSLRLLGDSRIEADETLSVSLSHSSSAAAVLSASQGSASVSVLNDDPKGEVSASLQGQRQLLEGASGSTQTHSFVLTRSGDTSQPATLAWRVGGTVDANDFAGASLPSGLARFEAGASTTTVTLQTRGDNQIEGDETLTLLLEPGDWVLPKPGAAPASLTLLDDDVAEFRVRALDERQSEGSQTGGVTRFRFEVSRGGDLSQPAQVSAQVEAASGSTGLNELDFAAGELPRYTLQFAAGEAVKTVEVLVSADFSPEQDESFVLRLSQAQGAALPAVSTAGATIVADDPFPVLSLSSAHAQLNEGQGGLTPVQFTLTRSTIGVASSVQWSLGGSIKASDLAPEQARSGTVQFASWESTQTVSIAVVGDYFAEANELLTLSLSQPQNLVLGAQTSLSVQILNDDAAPRAVQGTVANNEKLMLSGTAGQYAWLYQPASHSVLLSDTVAGRDGALILRDIEALGFQGSLAKALPSSQELGVMQLAQVVLGAPGLYPQLWSDALGIAKGSGLPALGRVAAEALYTGQSAPQMADRVLSNLGIRVETLGGDDAAGSYAWTRDFLIQKFGGDATQRGAALLELAQVLGTLEGHAVYGAVAEAFNERIGAEWSTELAALPVTLVGLVDPLQPFPLP